MHLTELRKQCANLSDHLPLSDVSLLPLTINFYLNTEAYGYVVLHCYVLHGSLLDDYNLK